MKKIKISLAVAVLASIGFCAWHFLGDEIFPPKVLTPPRNEFIERIEGEIDSLKRLPASVFCKEFYNGIQYRINDYHKQQFLGKNLNDNSQWMEILSKNLYTAYAPKFAEQALYVFKGTEWKIADLHFIRSEVITVQSSNYLEHGSSVDNSFKNIRSILSKYDEISGFITLCSNISYSYSDINSRFPINDVTNKIQKAKTYLSNNLDNSYVNNCPRLKAGLKGIPLKLFSIHVAYLKNKIHFHSSKYTDYNYQSDYSKVIYTPLKNELNELDNEIYGIEDNTFDSNYNSLEGSLNADNLNAAKYFLLKK